MSDSQDKTAKVHPASSHDPLMEVFEPGLIVGGKYKIVSLLGTGGMGCVYRAEQVFLQQDCALKTLSSHKGSDISMRRFQIEARAASSLNHPNLVKVTDFGLLEDQRPYLVMDFVDGITLGEYLKKNGPLSVEQAAVYFAQACLGLSYAHDQGVVHRDIKPSNLMIAGQTPFGAEGSVRVVDFGIAKLTSSENGENQALTSTGEIFGSPLYMSPEQASGAPVDHRSDIYSLGCVLFESLTGTAPHVGQNALTTMMLHQSEPAPALKEASLGKEFPPALEHLVAKMLAKAPADRYQNLGLVANDLALISKGVMPAAVIKGTPVKKTEKISLTREKFYLVLLSASIAAATIAGISGYWLGRAQRHLEGGGSAVNNDTSTPGTQDSAGEAEMLPKALDEKGDRFFARQAELVQDDRLKNEYFAVRKLMDDSARNDRRHASIAYQRLNNLLKQIQSDPALDQSYVFGLHERLAEACFRLGKSNQEQSHLIACLKSARNLQDRQMIVERYLEIARLRLAAGSPKEAVSAWLRAAGILEEMSVSNQASAEMKAVIIHSAAGCYRTACGICSGIFKDYGKAAEYGLKAVKLYEACGQVGDLDYACNCLTLGNALNKMERYEEARPILLKALPFLKRAAQQRLSSYRLIANVYCELAGPELAQGHVDTARKYYVEARQAVLLCNDKSEKDKRVNAEVLANINAQLKALGN